MFGTKIVYNGRFFWNRMCAGCVTAEDKLDNVTPSEKEREEGGGVRRKKDSGSQVARKRILLSIRSSTAAAAAASAVAKYDDWTFPPHYV